MNHFLKYLIAASSLLFLTQCTQVEQSAFQKNWQLYKQSFIEHGRIVDTANQNISHSEGQGYGLLFAFYADDKSQFKDIWLWSKETLQRKDKLFSWKYEPCAAKNSQCVTDPNNASDGDILIAWALLMAAENWGIKEYREQALEILDAIKSKLVYQQNGYLLLKPAEYGFDLQNGDTQINLSYWVFPALNKFFDVTGDANWKNLYRSGVELLEVARFGQWQLQPDWLILTQNSEIRIEQALSQEYGYNACRIPIYLMMANDKQSSLITPFLKFWGQEKVPATVNLENGNEAEYVYSSGMEAIAIATKQIISNQTVAVLPAINKKTDYYSASLILLSQLAMQRNDDI